jgi:hypothetical protein
LFSSVDLVHLVLRSPRFAGVSKDERGFIGLILRDAGFAGPRDEETALP